MNRQFSTRSFHNRSSLSSVNQTGEKWRITAICHAVCYTVQSQRILPSKNCYKVLHHQPTAIRRLEATKVCTQMSSKKLCLAIRCNSLKIYVYWQSLLLDILRFYIHIFAIKLKMHKCFTIFHYIYIPTVNFSTVIIYFLNWVFSEPDE